MTAGRGKRSPRAVIGITLDGAAPDMRGRCPPTLKDAREAAQPPHTPEQKSTARAVGAREAVRGTNSALGGIRRRLHRRAGERERPRARLRVAAWLGLRRRLRNRLF